MGIYGHASLKDLVTQERFIFIRTLAGFRYLCPQLAYLVLSKIFLIVSEIGDLLRSYQEYPTKSVSKQGEDFLIVALVES
jgi:hypothetical protein